MAVETWKLSESTKTLDKKKTKEKELQEEVKSLEFKKTKEKISTLETTESKLEALKEMLANWEIDEETKKLLEKVIASEDIDESDVEVIFQKIDEIEDMEDIDKYLPKENRITKEEYKKALTDSIFRTQTLTKIDVALTILYTQLNPKDWMWLNLFKWYLIALDKNLIKLQENHIDIKESLVEIDEKINKLSLWQRFVKFLKEIFSA